MSELSKESWAWSSFKMMLWNEKGTIRERKLVVKIWQRGKNFTINEKKSNSKSVSSVSFLGCSVSKEWTAPGPKHVEKIKKSAPPSKMKQLEAFAGLANLYWPMIPDLCYKIVNFEWNLKRPLQMAKKEENAFENIKSELRANPCVQPRNLL